MQEKASLVPFVLIILAVGGDASHSHQCPLVLIKILISHSYFASGLLKLRRTGLHWVCGKTLQVSQHFGASVIVYFRHCFHIVRRSSMKEYGGCSYLDEIAVPLLSLTLDAWYFVVFKPLMLKLVLKRFMLKISRYQITQKSQWDTTNAVFVLANGLTLRVRVFNDGC